MFVNMTFVCVQVHNYGCRVKLFNVHKFQKAERFVCSAESPDRLWVLPRLLIDVNPAFFWGGGTTTTGPLDWHSPSYVGSLRTRGFRPVSPLTRTPLCHGA